MICRCPSRFGADVYSSERCAPLGMYVSWLVALRPLFTSKACTSVAVAGCNRIRRPRFDVNGTSASAESVVSGQSLAKDCWQSQFDRARTAVPSLSRK